jgi:hypothetical protein
LSTTLVHDFLDAAGWVTLLTIGLTALTFFIGFLLPKRARQQEDAADGALPAEAAAAGPAGA